MSNLRHLVMQSFKKIHRTRLKVFKGDIKALTAARHKINEEYKKNKHVSDAGSIQAMIEFSEGVERELRTCVIQARELKPGVFEAKITQDTVKLDNIPYNDAAVIEEGADAGPARPCCQEQPQNK
ncbi:complex III assembly factor LYRM7 [Pectinophora gossypiella]|uniref:Complex III assembly factor LYRM7 n=1 Tax=Pectinophora gossypiella TaxID=13191 RepID=A0A1E1WSD8_PECGO|nr:complex III assembly factor LYRM7 [Pectinophora gossypiella]